MARSTSQLDASPVTSAAKFGRVDQGIDITQRTPFLAAASGVVSYIDRNFWRGTPAVYITLDNPVTINGRTYTQLYYSETPALVNVGQRVRAGQPISAPGTAEIGFANNNLPAAHGHYVEGQKTVEGQDFASALANVLYRNPADITPDTSVTSTNLETGTSTTSTGPKTGGLVGGIANTVDFLNRITNGDYILRGLEIVAGAVMVLLGVYLLTRQIGLASPSVPASLAPAREQAEDAAETVTVHRIGIRQTKSGNVATRELGTYEREAAA